MLTHHVVTLALGYFAFVKGYYRFLMLALFCHDICDIFLHCVSMAKYVDNVRYMPDVVQIPAFLPLPLSWVVFRLYLFPRMYVIVVYPPPPALCFLRRRLMGCFVEPLILGSSITA